jgi:hypothetical protein
LDALVEVECGREGDGDFLEGPHGRSDDTTGVDEVGTLLRKGPANASPFMSTNGPSPEQKTTAPTPPAAAHVAPVVPIRKHVGAIALATAVAAAVVLVIEIALPPEPGRRSEVEFPGVRGPRRL